ncbi:hypothetical protein D0862_15066 [Hortaea werneckii]|uniref:Chromo domain-containing protein n=1 Tax=Hortaea werneckii TaxID=91943 RepID=A0A3M7DU60_HORWE|nr:hypothetical protein D0862_15066 [Hortaea werneckii]
MPPAISDHESGSEDDIPDQIPARVDKKATEPTQDEEEDDNDEDEEDEDEYRVEKIVKHDWLDDGTLVYQIKWQGYEDPGDMTWEPVENLEGAKDILQTYLKKIGGTPEPPAPKPKRGSSTRKSGGGKRSASEAFATDSPAPASSSKKRGKGKPNKTNGTLDDPAAAAAETTKRALPPGTWDNDVLRVTSIIEESVPSTTSSSSARNKSIAAATNGKETKELIGLLEWKDGGAKTQHKMKVLRQKVPQRLLDYYEQHLVFTDAGANQTDAANKNEEEEDQEGEDVEMK